jgi:aminoglycoside 6'-N-acetyltransferase
MESVPEMASPWSCFRPLTDDDLPTMYRWLNDPGVAQWWEGDDLRWEGVVADYGSGNNDPVEHWMYLVDGRPAGWIQNYRVCDLPDVARLWSGVDHHPDVVGIDFLIGGHRHRGRGLGSTMIAEFSRFLFERSDPPPQLAADPLEANVASWTALEKAGFRCLGVIPDWDHGPVKVMALDHPDR